MHWQPWDEAALAAAREQDKPILLSVGYAACHWCHVMAHESFENPAIAALMNAHFVNIKVDREERPDLDQIYQHALALLGQQGGWPLTMFLTPAGEPFWGGTYFPPESRYGRPGLPEVLETVGRIWRDERDKVASNTTALKEALAAPRAARRRAGARAGVSRRRPRSASSRRSTPSTAASAARRSSRRRRCSICSGARRCASGDAAMRHAVLHTLTNICQGGIYDHLGGGFARYSVDALWLVPHFEKMLYDNAQLLALLADASADTAQSAVRGAGAETVGWLEREMLVEDAFASSLDADSEGEEGKFYVWQAAEIDRLLGADAAAFRLAYGVTDGGNWEGKTVLNRLHQPGLLAPDAGGGAARERRSPARGARRAGAARARRQGAGRLERPDDRGARQGERGVRPAGLAASARERAFAFVAREMTSGDRLAHSWRAGRTPRSRLSRGLRADGGRGARPVRAHRRAGLSASRPRRWLARLDADYLDAEHGGYFQVPATPPTSLVRAKNAQDGPTPAGNGTLVGGARPALLPDRRSPPSARAPSSCSRPSRARSRATPRSTPPCSAARCWLDQPVQVVIIGAPGEPGLRGAAPRPRWRRRVPAAVVLTGRAGHGAAGRPSGRRQGPGRRPRRPPMSARVRPVGCRSPSPAELAGALAPASLRAT